MKLLQKNKLHNKYASFRETNSITFRAIDIKLQNSSYKLFSLGSCFAMRLKEAFAHAGFHVEPDYREEIKECDYNYEHVLLDVINNPRFKSYYESHINHYTPYSILQELRRASSFGQPGRHIEPDSLFIETKCLLEFPGKNITYNYQDIGRRDFFAVELDQLKIMSAKVSNLTFKALASANIIVYTLGLTEQFFLDTAFGPVYFNQHPNYSGSLT